MAKITYAPGIETVSGAMSKINKKSQHANDQTMFLATHRNAESCSRKCSRSYFRKVYNLPWTTAVPTTDVLAQREAFATSSRAVAARKKDLSAITRDLQKYAAIRTGVLAHGYTISYTSFLWALWKKNNDAFPQGDYEFSVMDYLNNTYSGEPTH